MKPPLDTVQWAETPEGVSLTLRPAGLPVRVLAFLIDAAIRWATLSVLSGILAGSGRIGVGALLICLFTLNWLYPIIFELMPGAATPGKRAMGLQVMMANGLPLTPAGCLTRNLLRAVDMLPLAYAFAAIACLLRGCSAPGGLAAEHHRDGYPRSPSRMANRPGDLRAGVLRLNARNDRPRRAHGERRLTAERAEEIAQIAAVAANVRTRPCVLAPHRHRPVAAGRAPATRGIAVTPREFEQRHSKQWDELEAQLDQPVTRLQPERFMTLYRQCREQLALAQARGISGTPGGPAGLPHGARAPGPVCAQRTGRPAAGGPAAAAVSEGSARATQAGAGRGSVPDGAHAGARPRRLPAPELISIVDSDTAAWSSRCTAPMRRPSAGCAMWTATG
ncbi:MAG: RDD family protein [Steroidobacteraceae bacterium]